MQFKNILIPMGNMRTEINYHLNNFKNILVRKEVIEILKRVVFRGLNKL